ncbi:lycopene cyclase domain-containing protein [Nocardioidaceae bacterium]|nr:lycopene cyclase domain-containing protein [Nocardioidaceae bacterium]
MGEYTWMALLSMPVVAVIDLVVLRTRVLLTARYWLSMTIVLAFMVLVDGWLTKLSAPIVLYADEATSGVRFPWDIPVEDFGFGISMCTLSLALWVRAGRTRGVA